MEFSQPPPPINNAAATGGGGTGDASAGPGGFLSGPPPGARPTADGGHENHHRGGFFNNHRGHHGRGHHHGGDRHNHAGGGAGGGGGGAGTPGQPFFRPFVNFARGPGGLPMTQDDFDGKRLRKSVMRKTVDYNAAIIRSLQTRVWQRDYRDRRALQPESIYAPEMLPPPSYMDNPTNAVTTRFVKTATNKMRCPIFTLAWTPEGRRLVTGASSGEFTLWNGLTFNFETILQAHDCPVRTMVWSHNDNWMVTGDHQGNVKYWQSNMNNVRQFQAHKEPVRGISFSPSDNKFVTCSDDGTLRVFDFLRCQEEKVLRGHGADVKCVHWHPQKSLIVSGSKDNQQPIKLWDPKSGQALATLHAHKSTVMDLKWNDNGNWLITASRDHLLKLFDLRNLKEEVQVFRGHKKEASAVSWHPVHEGLFSSGGSDGSILFWNVGTDKEVGAIEAAHDSIVWTLAWHPLGHILCSGSNDHTIKFWTRNRPGDQMRDKYNLNTLPIGLQGLEECELEENHVIPGMGPEDKIDFTESLTADRGFIPGLDLDVTNFKDRNERDKKVPYSKPIPRSFVAQWNDSGRPNEEDGNNGGGGGGNGDQPRNRCPSAIIVYGVTIPIPADSRLAAIVAEGPMILNRFISAREIPELNDLLPADEPLPEGDDADKFYDHNVEIIFENDAIQLVPNGPPPSMMLGGNSMDGELNLNEPPPNFQGPNGAHMGGDRDDRDMWPPNNGPPPPMPWMGVGPPGNPFAVANHNMSNPPPNMMNHMGGMDGMIPRHPMMGNNMDGNWDGPPPGMGMGMGGFRHRGPDKFRRMDEGGRRMSRFDNNDGGPMRHNRPPMNHMNDNNNMDMMNNGGGGGGFGGNRFGSNNMDNNGPPNNMMGGPPPNHMMGNTNTNQFDNTNFDNNGGGANGPNDFGNMGGNNWSFNNRGMNRGGHKRRF